MVILKKEKKKEKEISAQLVCLYACVLCMCTVHVYIGAGIVCACVLCMCTAGLSFHCLSLSLSLIPSPKNTFNPSPKPKPPIPKSPSPSPKMQAQTQAQAQAQASGPSQSRLMIKLPMCIIKDILSYFEMDIYQDKKGGTCYIFTECVFPRIQLVKVSHVDRFYDVEESRWIIDQVTVYTRRVYRRNSLVTIKSTTRNGIESPHHFVSYSILPGICINIDV